MVQLKIAIEELYYTDQLLIKDINISVNKKDKVLIVGSTGSGKTSLLHTLNLMNDSYEGTISFNGTNIKAFPPEELRGQIMEVMQEPYLEDMSVIEVLKAPWEYSVHNSKEICLDWEQSIIDLFDSFRLNKDYLQKKTSKLSGGEKQRIALIRALQFNPQVLLLDEISSALDAHTSEIISECLFQNYEGTIIAISHDHLWQNRWLKIWEIKDQKLIIKENY